MARIALDIEAGQVSAELARRGIPSNTRVHVEVDLVSASELPMSAIAQTGKGPDWLTDEPDFYSDADLVQRNRSTSIQEWPSRLTLNSSSLELQFLSRLNEPKRRQLGSGGFGRQATRLFLKVTSRRSLQSRLPCCTSRRPKCRGITITSSSRYSTQCANTSTQMTSKLSVSSSRSLNPGRFFRFRAPSQTLATAIQGQRPILYVRVSITRRQDLCDVQRA
jgi:hypothetical protein